MTEAPSDPAPVPAPPARSAAVRRRLAALEARVREDVVLASEVADFLPGDWQEDGVHALCRVGERWCRVASDEVSIGHDRWPGSKRIPLR